MIINHLKPDEKPDLPKEINQLLVKIEEEFPELYVYLDENPSTIPNMEHPVLGEAEMLDYLESLQQLVMHHRETHPAMKEKSQPSSPF